MGGIFGIISKQDCVQDCVYDLFFGTDYHFHLGTKRGGLAVKNDEGIEKAIHSIEEDQFRPKFKEDVQRWHGKKGIGAISDTDPQPLVFRSHLGEYALVTVGKVSNLNEIVNESFIRKKAHFSEMSGGDINQTEVIATIMDRGDTFQEGIRLVQDSIRGSISMMVLTDKGVYAARDKFGRTPIILGARDDAYAAASETNSFPNLGFEISRFMGPAEIVLMTPDGIEQLQKPGEKLQICSFLWVYFGFPASDYEGINVEDTRYRCGANLAREDDIDIDIVAGIPDSGTAHAIGYANARGLHYKRPIVKYTPTWPRSFMPQEQRIRDMVAKMKLIPIKTLIDRQRILFCEDSIVRGTQLQQQVQAIYDCGAKEVHMRPASPPLVFGCPYLNFSRSRSEMDLAARRAIRELEGVAEATPEMLAEYTTSDSEKQLAMIDRIRERLGLTTLKYQKLNDLVESISLPADRLCQYCWTGK
ncbi:amidophosphoribosyltransferase [Candidatus Woesearchaeota archaeon]|nr:amidophosphoribosyltransferase [Candidatus Woesearchaeota archaeon]